MIHRFVFAGPNDGLGEQEFHRAWTTEQAPEHVREFPALARHVVNTRIAADVPAGWTAVSESWLDDAADSDELAERLTLAGTRLAAARHVVRLDTTTHVLRERPAASGGIKLISTSKRASGVSLREFRDHDLREHAPMTLNVPGVVQYQQCYTVDSAYRYGEPPFDGVHVVWFDDAAALQAAQRTDEFAAVVADSGSYTDLDHLHSLMTTENWIAGGEEVRNDA